MNLGVISLGCAKNQVDLEEILYLFKANGFNIVNNPKEADYILINTCAFILDAKKESLKAIFDMLEYNKPLIVTGCLPTRYIDTIKDEIPEVKAFIPINEYTDFSSVINNLISDIKLKGKIDPTKRLLLSNDFEAYLRISDGCNNNCTFCAIPSIRGKFKSVPLNILKEELNILDKNGIKSLTVISQDTSMYGIDINSSLVELVKEINKHKNFQFVKLMYLYPDEVSDELISLFKENNNLTPYFDLPIQHTSNHVLKRMGRRGTREDIFNLINKIKQIDNAIIRTTVMVGFPGETKEDFETLLNDIDKLEFDHLGCFTYSEEENTPSSKFTDDVSDKEKNRRKQLIMKKQRFISRKLNKNRINKEYKCLITSYDQDSFSYSGITNLLAPDDIDGKLIIYSDKEIKIGSLVNIKIVNSNDYDLEAVVLN